MTDQTADRAAAPVKQRADCTETEWAEQERARFERLYTRETVRADTAARDAEIYQGRLKRLGEGYTKQRQRAEQAEAEAERLRTDRAATCICEHTEAQHFEDACLACDCGDYLVPEAAREVIARWRAAATRAPTDRATVLDEAASRYERLLADMGADTAKDPRYWLGVHHVTTGLRHLAVEARPDCDGCGHAPHPVDQCQGFTFNERCECDEPVGAEARQDETQVFTVQVWPLTRVLTEARCGSQDWTWDEEWADLDRRHAESGYLAKLEQDIRANGITMPVLIGTDGRIWDGHHRLRIAVLAEIDYVPVEVPAAAPAVSSVGQEAPATRGAEWRAAADHLDGLHLSGVEGGIRTALTDELRRMADETQQPEARPSLTEWVVETLWRDGDWRSYYPARNTRDEAHREYENAVRRDADHAYRLTCATTAYAVEAEHQPAAGAPQDPTQDSAAETVHGCPPDGSGLAPCCGRTPFELPLGDRISSEAPITCPGPAAGAQQPKETSNPRTVCVCGHTKGEHLTVSGRLLCDACDPDSTDNLVCRGFDAL